MKWLFREKFKVSQEKSKTDLPQVTCKQRCKRWDRKIASGFGLLAFLTLVGIVIFNIFHPNLSCNSEAKFFGGVEFQQKCTVNAKCEVTCSNIDENIMSVADYINEALKSENCNSITKLTIKQTDFRDSELNNGWLTNIQPQVEHLIIEKCTLEKINIRAFAEHPFNTISHIRIINADLKTLTRDSFLGLNTLTHFEFFNYGDLKPLKIEERVLEGMSTNLVDLHISKYILSSEDIINLTGNTELLLPKLVILTLAHNSITELKDNSFISATIIKSLYLHTNGLRSIHQNAFRGQTALKHLNLSTNILETLPQDVFKGLNNFKTGGIELSSNLWKCDCSLQWLKEYYVDTNAINTERPPLCFPENIKFDVKDFCTDLTSTASTPSSETDTSSLSTAVSTVPFPSPSTSSSLSSSTSLEESQTTTVLPPGFMRIKCQDQKFSPEDAKVDVTHRVEVEIKNKNIELQFLELVDEDSLYVKITTEEELTDYNLFWFNVDNKDETGCRTIVQNNMLLDELNRGTMYSFSLIYGDESEVAPKCTFCLKTEPEWKFRSWIDNRYQTAVISLTVLIAVFLISLAAFITYICIRRHPKIISGNKSVIILKPKKDTEEELPPLEYERPAYWDPYLVPSSHGYLTPKNHRYAKVRYRPPLMRSISEWSVTSTTNQSNYQYEDPRHLHALKILRPRRQNITERIESDVYDYRPPLPPPNPGSKRPSAPMQEDLYGVI